MRRLIAPSTLALSTLVLSTLTLTACGGDDDAPAPIPCSAPGSIIADATAWRVADDADDPWGATEARCPPAQHRVEVQGDVRWHEIETVGCSTATLTQPIRVGLCEGEAIEIELWNFPITEGDGPWRLAVGVSDGGRFEVLGAIELPLPELGGLVEFTGRAPRDLPAGSPLWLRLSNHGTNTWNLYDIVSGPDPLPDR